MRIKEIEARLAAIKQEIEQRGDAMTAAEIDALEQETTQLTEERAGLIAAAEKRNGILDNIAKGAGIVSRSFQQNNGDDNAAPDDPFGTPEYRSAWLKNIRRLPLNDAEKRAFSNASGAGAEVIPTQTANEIISKVKTLAPMLNEVTLLHVKGAVKFAIEGTNNAAAIHTENASITAAADTLTTVSLSGYEIVKLVQISDSRDMTLQGIVEKISSLIWTRRYWSCGEFKLLVPFTEEHARLLVKENIIIKRGGNEAAEIRYIHITKNSQGMEEIEVQGKFLLSWIGKRILTTQIITKDTTQNILYAIVKQTCTNAGAARNIPNFSISTTDADTGSGQIDYTSEQYANAQLAAETAAKAAKLGIRVLTNARTGKHTFSVYEGRDLTAGNTAGNAPCIFSQEFDNIVEQEYTNSVENLKTTAYVGGEEKEGVTRKVAEVGGSSTGLSRDEVFINATDIVQEYENESGQTVTLTNAQYLALLSARGVEELEQYAETLAFGSKINTNANLKYGTDYDLGDRVTCINKRWNVRIDVRITEIAETYETSGEEIDITFGESLPALLTQIRQITK